MTDAEQAMPTIARAAVAAGLLIVDDHDRIMMVRPTYKPEWEIPGGYVEPGESPRAACAREIAEELGLFLAIGSFLTVDWAPHPVDGDKLLFIFDGGQLTREQQDAITLQPSELTEYRYVPLDQVHELTIPRLARRLIEAFHARQVGQPTYLEHGTIIDPGRP